MYPPCTSRETLVVISQRIIEWSITNQFILTEVQGVTKKMDPLKGGCKNDFNKDLFDIRFVLYTCKNWHDKEVFHIIALIFGNGL